MPEKVLGLDIREDSITALQLKSELKGYQVTACARALIKENGGLEHAMDELSEQVDLSSDLCFGSIPARYVSYRNLKMPFRESKKIKQTLPFEIEAMVPFPVEDVILDFTISKRSDQSEILAVLVEKTVISRYLEELQPYGIDPGILDIESVSIVSWLLRQGRAPENGLFLDLGEKKITMVLFVKRRVALIRTFSSNANGIFRSFPAPGHVNDAGKQTSAEIEHYFRRLCSNIENTIHAFVCRTSEIIRPERIFFTGTGALYSQTGTLLNDFLGVPAEEVDVGGDKRVRMGKDSPWTWNPALMNGALALALRDTKQTGGFNLRKDEFKVSSRYSDLKKRAGRAALLVLTVLAFLAADVGVDYYFLQKRYGMLDQKIKDVFAQTFPDVKRIEAPVSQAKIKINEMKKSSVSTPRIERKDKVLVLLRDISQRIPDSLDVRVTRMVIDPESVRIDGITDTFNTVDNIKNGLKPSAYFSSVTISSAKLDRRGKRVQFKIKLKRGK